MDILNGSGNGNGDALSVATLSSVEPQMSSKVYVAPDFDAAQADRMLKDFFKDVPPDDEETRFYYYTEPHIGTATGMGLFGDFAPSIVFSVNKHHGLHLPYRESTLQEFAWSKLCHLYCTLDRSVMFGFHNRHMAKSKVFNLNSAAAIMGRPELEIDPSPLEDKEVSADAVEQTLFQVKKNATKLLKDVRTQHQGSMTLEEKVHDLQYPGMLADVFGTNLVGILLYGSSSQGKGNDFDNFAVLKDLPDDLYKRIRGLKPQEGGKDVGIIFVPEYVLEKFLYINVSNTLFRNNAKVLKGRFVIPLESDRYVMFKEMYHAGFGSGKLISALNLVYREPQILFDKPGLFEYFMKLNRFTYHGLAQKDGYVLLKKEDILAALKEQFDFEIPGFRADAAYLQECFLKANKASVDIARKMYSPRIAREPNEALVTLQEQVDRRIFRAKMGERTIYVFQGTEPMVQGNVIPVRVLQPGEDGYNQRMREVHYKGVDTSREFMVGRRV